MGESMGWTGPFYFISGSEGNVSLPALEKGRRCRSVLVEKVWFRAVDAAKRPHHPSKWIVSFLNFPLLSVFNHSASFSLWFETVIPTFFPTQCAVLTRFGSRVL